MNIGDMITVIDNFRLILPHLKYENVEDHFYLLEVIKRRKENPEMKTGAELLNVIYLYNGELEQRKDEIIAACHKNKARAYIRLNRRSAMRTAIRTLQKVAEFIDNGNCKAAKKAYYSASTSSHSDPQKKWLIDIDMKNDIYVDNVSSLITTIGGVVYARVPTLNGVHLITSPFNRANENWKHYFSKIDVHKDNPTVLYGVS